MRVSELVTVLEAMEGDPLVLIDGREAGLDDVLAGYRTGAVANGLAGLLGPGFGRYVNTPDGEPCVVLSRHPAPLPPVLKAVDAP